MTASPALALPRLRADLAISRQTSPQGAVFVLKDPVRGQFYRFREAEHFIAGQLDGATSLDVVRERAQQHFGAALQPEVLTSFVKRLDKAGLLEKANASKPKTNPRLAGSLLYLRFRAFDPNRLFDFLIGKIRFFFTPWFLAASAASILLAVYVAASGWEEIVQTLPRLYSTSAIPIILAVFFLVITAHEFAHGLTCKYFGGEVREIGFFLVYFQPALYCNVSDAWLFPEKSKRLWVGFAGPYFELFLWSLATFVWRLTDVDTWWNYLAFIVVTSSGIKTLLNFNPFIKLDGYYLLSDWLEFPNLRTRAFAEVGNRIKRLFARSRPSTDDLTPLQRRVCVAYGLVAALGSISILGYAVTKLGSYFLTQPQPMAFVIFAGLLGTKVQRRIRRLFGKGSPDPDDDDPDVESPASTESRPKSRSKRKSRWVRRLTRLVLAAAVLGGLWAVLLYTSAELKIGGAFDILPIHNADVRARVEGLIEQVSVDEGQVVAEGGLIARLDDRDTTAELRKTEAAIQEARARLRLLEAGPRAEEIVLARASLAKADERVKFAQSRLERDRALYEQKLLSGKDFEDTQASLADRQNELAEARGRLQVLLAGSRPEEIDATKAELQRLDAQQRYLAEQLQLLKVVSPAAGIVATPSRQLQEMRHQLVKKGDLIAKVFDLKTITAEIVISEKDIADISLGQKVVLKARAYPERTFLGKVTSIATAAQANQNTSLAQTLAPAPASTRSAVGSKMVLVTTEIENTGLLLKPEMTGQAKIFCGRYRLLDLVKRRIARTVKVQFWSWW